MSRTNHPRRRGSHRVSGRVPDRWRSSNRAAVEFIQHVLDGLNEYADCATERGLDYVTHDYRHLWRARQDRRHWGRRATDRTRHFTRPDPEALRIGQVVVKQINGVWYFRGGGGGGGTLSGGK